MNLVTIITPIYNGEKYLIRYFEQVNAIRYKNLQIIVVNDGSKDKTSEIVQKYAEEDSRIEFINKKVNEGVSSARNDALKRAKGTFCFFFDCDDTFDAQIVEKCVAKVKSDTDTVCYNYASVRRNGSIAEHEFSYLKHQYNKKEILEQILPRSFGTSITDLKGYLSGKHGMRQGKELNGPWRMMYSLEIIRKENIYFRKDLRVGEDTIFTNKYLAVADVIYTIDEPLYYLHNNDGSAIETYNLDVNRMISGKLQLIKAKDELSDELQRKGMDTYELWGGEYILSSVQIGYALAKDKKLSFAEKCKVLKSYHLNSLVKKQWNRLRVKDIMETKSIKAIPVLLLKINWITLTELMLILFCKMGFKIS